MKTARNSPTKSTEVVVFWDKAFAIGLAKKQCILMVIPF